MEKPFMFHRLSNSPYVDKEFCAEFKLNREKMKFGLIEYENGLVEYIYDDKNGHYWNDTGVFPFIEGPVKHTCILKNTGEMYRPIAERHYVMNDEDSDTKGVPAEYLGILYRKLTPFKSWLNFCNPIDRRSSRKLREMEHAALWIFESIEDNFKDTTDFIPAIVRDEFGKIGIVCIPRKTVGR